MKLFSKPIAQILAVVLVVALFTAVSGTLIASADYEPGHNFARNPGFQEDTEDRMSPPTGWEVTGPNAHFFQTRADSSAPGGMAAGIWMDAAGYFDAHQTITDLPNGIYTYRMKFKRTSGDFINNYIYVKNHGGTELRADFFHNGDYSNIVEIENIHVTTGTVTFGIYIEIGGDEGASMRFDDVEFVLVSLDSPSASEEPSEAPSEEPSEDPSEEPSEDPSEEPSEEPSEAPSEAPSEDPSEEPSEAPSEAPSEDPSEEPSEVPSGGTSGDDSSTPSSPGSPKTGDTSNTLYFMLILTVAAAVTFVLVPKKRTN